MNNSPIRGLIFDLGGTLIFSDRGRLEKANAWSATHFLRAQGFRGDPEGLWQTILEQRRRGQDILPRQHLTRDALREATRACGFSISGDLLEEAELAFFAPELAATTPIPGMIELVKGLQGRVRLALFSNTTSHAFIEKVVDRVGLGEAFSPLMTSAACGYRKPQSQGFEDILRFWGLPPRDIVMVGDDVDADVRPAQALGMRTLWLRTDLPSPCANPPPTPAADNAAGVRTFLASCGLDPV